MDFRPLTQNSDQSQRRNPNSASLRAAEVHGDTLVPGGIGISNNSPIWPDGLVPNTLHEVSIVENSPSKISFFNDRETEKSIFEIAILEDSSKQNSFMENSSLQIGITQVGPHQVSEGKVSTSQDSSFQINTSQVSAVHNTVAQINSLQVSISKPGFSIEVDPTEISLPSSITLQQLLSSHHYNFQNTMVST